jgi:RNA polymerase sigma factor (sigma-70 family)
MIAGKDSQTFTSTAYARYGGALRRYLRNRLKNKEDARELAQEVWTRLLRIDDPARVQSPRAYLYKVAANVLAEFQHLHRRDPVVFDSALLATAAEGEDCSRPDSSESLNSQGEVYRLLSTLPPTYRQIVLWRVCQGESFEAIGGKLGLTAGTAKRYCQGALTRIRREYGKNP